MISYIRLDYISNVFPYLTKTILSQNLTKVLDFSVFFVFFLWRQEASHMIQPDLETIFWVIFLFLDICL